MEPGSVSPPKTQRQALQTLTYREANSASHRNRNSIKKKLQIEQENVNPLYNIPYPQSSKCKVNYLNQNSMLPLISEIASLTVAQKDISSLPLEIHIEILKFISPEELINTIPFLNKYWYKASHDTMLWNIINQSQKLMVDVKYLKQKCIVERRSRGKLFKAVSRVSHENFVIRRINLAVANGGHDDGIPTSILREISYLTNLNHNNISKVKEVEINKEILQICSEYQDYNLKEYMKLFLISNKSEKSRAFGTRAITTSNFVEYKMPLKKVKVIAYQILQGLNYLHHQGIIHRNLKADNILVNENGTVKVSDFALSKLITLPHTPYTPEDPKDRERSGREARRLWYRAPELLLRKKKYSFETDIWAFGCILAEIALNEALFNGETEIEQLFKMFSLTGSPNTSNWGTVCDEGQFKMIFPKWESVYFPYICCPNNSQEFKQVYKVFVPNRDRALRKLESLGAVLGYEGLDLLWNCLSINPQLRSNANTLLNHAFFDEIRNEMQVRYSDTLNCRNESCNKSGFYTSITTPECHLISLFNTLKTCEAALRPSSNYLEEQTALTEHMRCILVDWLIDVSVHFDFLDETLHLAVNYIDRTLSKIKLDKTKLQLVGVTCLKIADVLHERSKEYYKQDNAKEYAYITADEYNPQQLIDMEKEIINMLEFNLVAPNAMHFLKVYIGLFQIPDNVAVIASFLTDLMLLSYPILEFEYSIIASAALFLACMCQNHTINEDLLMANRQFVNCYRQENLRRCVASMKDLWVTITTTTLYASFDAVYSKYQNKYSFCGKSLNPPAYTAFNIQNWFYSR